MDFKKKKKPMRSSFGVFDELEVLREVLNARPVLRDRVLQKIRSIQGESKVSIIEEVKAKLAERDAKLKDNKK